MVLKNLLDFDLNGKYQFSSCEDCNGPLLGHMKAKCPKIGYGDEDVKKFENYLKRIGGFKEALWARDKKNKEENEKIKLKKEEIRASKFAEAVRLALESKKNKTMPGTTTQLVKSRQPPLWSGQQFNIWRIEVERWYENNKSSDEEKYIDLLETLKRMKF